MSDAQLAIEAEDLTLEELEAAAATMKRQGDLVQRILARRKAEGPRIIYLEMTSIRAVVSVA